MAENIAIIKNGKVESAAKQNGTNLEDLSIQRRTLSKDDPHSVSSVFWFGDKRDDETLISRWWTAKRDLDLRKFWMLPNNDILQGAVSSMVKKFKSMNWVIEGPKSVVNRDQKVLLNAEFGQGWGILLAKTLTDYLTQDKGAFWELLGDGDLDGILEGTVLGIAHLDSQFCQLTGDIEFPVIFHNSKTGKPHKLHATRVAHFVDMPSPNELMYNTGFCAVSRVIGSSEILLKVNKYKNEKLDDLPQAGILALSNVLPQQWNDENASYSRERRKMNQQHWANVMALFSLDPTQPITVDFTSFADLPNAFNELETTNIYLNIVALAFGVDTREFWPITGGSLGTATESEVMHQKARGKGVGDIIGMLERIINWQILPKSATFRFDFKDDEEDLLTAEIDEKRTNTIMSMWKPGDEFKGTDTPVSVLEIRQMLADNVSYFNEDFLVVDITEETEATDTEEADETEALIERMYGPIIEIDHKGTTRRIKHWQRKSPARFYSAIDMAKENYEKGQITAEQVAEFALAELIDRN